MSVDPQTDPGAAEPDRMAAPDATRAAVIFGSEKADVLLPSAASVAETAHKLVPLLTDLYRSRGHEIPHLKGAIVLRRVDGTVLDGSRTVGESLTDGDLLVLTAVPAPRTLQLITEEISTALAEVSEKRFPTITEEAAVVTGGALLAGTAAASVGVAYLGWRHTAGNGWNPATAIVFAVAAVVLFSTAAVTSLLWKRPAATAGTVASAVICTGAVGFFVVPSTPGAAHILLASVATAVAAAVIVQLGAPPRLAWPTALVAALGVAVVGALRLLVGWSVDQIAIGTMLAAVLLASPAVAPHIGARIARIAALLPPFPTVTGGLVFDSATDLADEAMTATESGWEPPSPARLLQISETGTAWASALVTAAGLAVISAAPIVVSPDKPFFVLRVLYVALIAGVFILRGRSFANRWQAIWLVVSAVAALSGAAARMAFTWHSAAAGAICAATVLGVALLGLLATVIVPVRVFSSPLRYRIGLLGWLMIGPLFPLALWLFGAIHFARWH
ncbi:type VII secretion integral membrane protein EccD [Tsukamurella sp. 8F]|uniref:type VII secretion integral membrane protein EccD n=1 Tax=unclassified Tsukamurella TaxID=2633480 RepID=UPI0023B9669E|nr:MULTISPECIES: type VII secretion integral membrane protein EccD [unclassified Tsukamurella]MDF0531139.1 type VII secretion integral membrane protein EccD [Tsukamurella sp. 8J]MDF0588385.1 type VII secretion integral membrane protein EccD [Tsukamurella sp. 8F]